MKSRIYPVILSGGIGSRLWPLSRALYPKQLLPLVSDLSLLQDTARRVSESSTFAAPVVVANEEHRFIIAEQLRQADVPASTIILEPEGRNTAPAVALAALHIAAEDADALMLVIPSDHAIAKPDAFLAAIRQGAVAAEAGMLVTFGVTPSHPETGYGYIAAGDELADAPGVCAVARFVEKPDRATAESYLAAGGYFWNAGIFLMRVDRYLAELGVHAPAILEACQRAQQAAQKDLTFLRPDAAAFKASPNISIDYAVMEKTRDAAVVPVDMAWNDVGSWSALWDIATKDGNGNATRGDVIALDSRNSYLRSDGPMVATVGVENLVVVATPDAVLVADRARAQDIKSVVDELGKQKRSEHISHVVVYRPWGSYQTADHGHRYQVKRIVVNPGQKLSLQKHMHRAEHWVVVQGVAKVTRDDETIMLNENESIYIPIGAVHRLENPGKIPLCIVEVQSGAYLGEDDIVRFDDTYGRI